MTNEEAIKKIDDVLSSDYHYDETLGYQLTSDDFEWLEEAKKALEKQIPKKPLHMHKNYYCPVCKEDGWMLWDDAVPNDMDKYCGICGQAIDWSNC